jgi:hypothetical protein
MRADRVVGFNALCTGVAGVVILLFTGAVARLYGVPESFAAYGVARWLGALLIGMSALIWALRPMVATQASRSILRALASLHAIAFIITAAQAEAVWSTTAGFVTAVVYLLFALVYAALARRTPQPVPVAA